MNAGFDFLDKLFQRGADGVCGWPYRLDGDSILFVAGGRIYRAKVTLARYVPASTRRALLEEHEEAEQCCRDMSVQEWPLLYENDRRSNEIHHNYSDCNTGNRNDSAAQQTPRKEKQAG